MKKSIYSLFFFCSFIFFSFWSPAVVAQCYEDFYVYQSYPYGALCSPQYATLRAEYFSYNGNVNGEFRWYTSDTDPNPVYTEYVSFSDLTSEYGLYASNGTTMWVSYFNYNTYCESYRTPYTFYISPSPTVTQDYAKQCRYDPAKIQVSSNTSGVTFQLYKLTEYYDPYWGWVQNYQLEQSNTSGYFEIFGFNASTDADKYYVKVYQPYGCSTPYYYQLWFEITGAAPPSISGNTSVNVGTGGMLYASGAPDFRWYDLSGSLVNSGVAYTIPSNFIAGDYTLNVQGISSDGTCLTDVATVNFSVNHPGVSYTPLYNSSNFVKTIDLSKPVGTVAGTPGVSSSGGATYTIPIYTPPGTNGLNPSVSIVYNSQSGNGIAGHGWNIAGLSAISRAGKNLYHNGIVAPASYTNQDAFILDGNRLNPITGVNGSNGTVYATESESFSSIISYGGSADNPVWFKVVGKDGSIMEFGNTNDSRFLSNNGQNIMIWRINRMQDINGNYIDFKYENGFRESRLSEINYTGNANTGLLPYNRIKFDYETRQDKGISYDGGYTMESRHLISTITVIQENTAFKSYKFNYGFNNTTSLLNELVETGSDGASLNSTIFLYGDEPQNILTQSTVSLQGPFNFFSGDFDADGKTDLLATQHYFDNTAGVRLDSSYSLIKDVNEYSYSLMYKKSLGQNSGSQILQDKKYVNFLTADYNGDGRDDVTELHTSAEYVNLWGQAGRYYRRINDGVINLTKNQNTQTSGYYEYEPFPFGYPADLFGNTYRYVGSKGNFFIPGDFDGDGNKDFIFVLAWKKYFTTIVAMPFYEFKYKAFLTSPSTNEVNREVMGLGFGANTTPDFYAGTVADADMIQVVDFDGDGKTEILVTKDNQSYILRIQRLAPSTGQSFGSTVIYTTNEITKDSKVYPGDFNNDRKTDLLVRNANGSWKILYGTSTSYTIRSFSFIQQPNVISQQSDKIIISDFNGDGYSDILHGFRDGTTNTSRFSIYYYRGLNSATPFFHEQYVYNNLLAYGDFTVGDFNGDGRSDLLNRYNVNQPADFISFKPNGKERLLSKITNGHNITVEFQYKNLTDRTTYPYFYTRTVSLDNPASKNPYNYIQLPIYAVSAIKSPNGIGGINTISYNYEDAVIHRTAKGFLGFLKMESKDLINGITSVTESEINTEFAVLTLKKQLSKFASSGELLSESFFNFSFVNLSTGYNDPKRFFMRNDKTLTIDHITGAATENTNTYDNYGNIISSTAKAGALSGNTVNAVETVVTTTSFSAFNTPFPARPTAITVNKTRTGAAAQSSTTTFSYNTNGSLASQTVFSGLPKSVTTSYSYNSFGNVTSVSVASAGLTTRTSDAVFDSKGRFAVTKSILIPGSTALTETYTYDAKWGQPLSHISGDCLTTLFEYDAFGRPKKTTFPTGAFVSNSLVWDVQGGNVFYGFTDYSGGKADSKQWLDVLGRPTKMQVAGFNNQWLTQLTTYNTKGKVASQTNTYYSNESPVTTIYSYDSYNRVTNVSSPVSSISTSYMKLANAQFQVVTSNGAGQSTTKITDASGKVIQSIDNGGQLNFSYDSRGNQLTVTHGSNTLVSSIYDVYGRQTSLTDKNAGTISYQYDAFGQLTQQTDNLGNTYTMNYDILGRVTNKQGPEGTTTYEYYYNAGTGCRNSNITKVTGFNGVIKEFTYDAYQRMQSEKLTVDGTSYTTQYAYNIFGQLTQTTYPSGIAVNNSFDNNGNLLTVSGGNAGSPVTLFTATGMNGFGQYTSYSMGNGKSSAVTYNYGIPTRYYTQGVQDLNLNFNYTTGNLTSRYDAIKNLTESFQYDNLNRFNTAAIGNTQQLNVNYDQNGSLSMGNIVSKTDAGNYVYKNDKINAVAYITNPAGPAAPPVTNNTGLQTITYTPFLKPATIAEAPFLHLTYTYGPDYERVKSEMIEGRSFETKLYFGNYEQHSKLGLTRETHYIEGGDGLCAMIVRESGVNNFYFVYKDHLGSLLTITDINGSVVAEQNFDAWGRNRNPVTWQYISVPDVPVWLYRGYTGHEHLPNFALINMNGRMYDPVQGRMLSADNFVPGTFSTQAFNRYSYAHNNPLTFIDPDGNHPAAVVILIAAAKAAAISTTVYLATNFLFGDPDNITLRGTLTAAGMGALGGALGGTFSLLGNSIGAFGQSLSYSMMQNVASQIAVDIAFGNRVTFGSVAGAALGGLLDGSIPEFKGIPFKKYNFGAGVANAAAELAINSARGAFVGGFSSVVGGGSFEEGARSGAMSRFIRTSINLAVLGPAIRPTGDIKLALNKMEKDLDIKLTGPYGPTYRVGGIWGRGLTVGRSAMISNGQWERDINDVGTWVHESFHYYQQLQQGWARMFANGVNEQFFINSRYVDVYDIKYMDRFNEAAANYYQRVLFPRLK
ncbi:MAG: FG-GAP-like repeat-containing protein [Chitinophagaceae bacterium]|nr:FG-GAP-like repeat-containing protein [Chitinophagaceae bacterium]